MNGKNIIKFRNDNGISQIELADKLGVARSTLSRWEKNKTTPHGDDYARLKDLMGEEYLTDKDLSESETTIDAINEMSDRVNNILYHVSRIEHNQRSIDEVNNRLILKHRKIRTTAIVITCIIIIIGFIIGWFLIMNYGIRKEVIEGTARMGSASYYVIDD